MSNPYESPNPSPSEGPRTSNPNSKVIGPAIALIVISIFAIVIGLIGLGFDVFLLASGAAARLDEMHPGRIIQIYVRTFWGILLVIASIFVLYGAIQMKQLKDYQTARSAAIVALIPCLGPCCLLGIPFGIWALVVLSKPDVKNAFN